MDIEILKFIFSVIAGTLAAIWAFFVWTKERKKQRELESKKRIALYVNPFLMACTGLQSRLYNILNLDGLNVLNDRYADKSYAEETLYMIVEYFAWEWCIYRYSDYAKQKELIILTEEVRRSFATEKFGLDAFCFFRAEQKSIGSLARERTQGEYGFEFDVISLHQFKQKLSQSPLKDSVAIEQTLAALKNSRTINDINSDVVDRMVKIQSNIQKVILYMQDKEGISLFTEIVDKK